MSKREELELQQGYATWVRYKATQPNRRITFTERKPDRFCGELYVFKFTKKGKHEPPCKFENEEAFDNWLKKDLISSISEAVVL